MIPRHALVLGLVGLIPFLWGAATELSPGLAGFGLRFLGPRFLGPYVSLSYGTILLAFMSGVLWGFATKADAARDVARGARFYALSVIPALWAFFFVGGGPVASAIYLAAGFLGLLGLDYLFWKAELAPDWWLRLRAPLAAVAVACLMVPAFG